MDGMEYDLLILGAGIYGIQAARTYLDIHPEAKILVFEAANTVGGSWSSERNYQDFWTQTPVGMAEFSDSAMSAIEDKDRYYDLFPAKYVTAYLEGYVDGHIYNEQTLRSRILTSTLVSNAKRVGGKWCVTTDKQKTYIARRLIDATGLTSIPNIPEIPGLSEFQGLALHQKDFGRSNFLQEDRLKDVVVIGGAKSGADVAYAAAKSGKNVTWIIRKSGAGPAAFFKAEGDGPFKNSGESLFNRFSSTFTASLWNEDTWWTKFLSRTRLGRFLVTSIWAFLDYQITAAADFSRLDGKERGYENLKPDTPVFWENDSSGVINHPDYYNTIATSVTVYREDVKSISGNVLLLVDGTTISADVIVYATGWSISNPHYDSTFAAQLGLPIPKGDEDPNKCSKWQALEETEDEAICARFPLLANPPPHFASKADHTPYRLYRGMIPASDDEKPSITFLGKVGVFNHFRSAETQALWAVGALDGAVVLPPREVMERDIARTVAWCRRRYLGKGNAGQWFPWDVVSYTDLLLKELGLRSHKRGGRGWKDFFSPCYAKDLEGVVAEYKEKYGRPRSRLDMSSRLAAPSTTG